jgi:hypothetical protein
MSDSLGTVVESVADLQIQMSDMKYENEDEDHCPTIGNQFS